MENKVYVFNNPERDNAEYAKHLALAAMKQMQIHNSTDIVADIKQIIEQAQADTRETDKVCYSHPCIYVLDRLSRAMS